MATREVLGLLLLISFVNSQVSTVNQQQPAVLEEPQPDSLTHDQKSDIVVEFYTSLSQLAHSIVDVHTDTKDGINGTQEHLDTLNENHAKMDYETKVMQVEHDDMVAARKKRSDVEQPELDDENARQQAINDAKNNLTALTSTIEENTTAIEANTEKMRTVSFSTEDLADVERRANAGEEDESEHITLPTTAETTEEVDKQIVAIITVINTLVNEDVQTTANTLVTSIREKFAILLSGESTHEITYLAQLAKEIDALLTQFRALDLYKAADRMEL